MHLLPVGSADCHLLPPILATNSGTIDWSSRILRFSGILRKTSAGIADSGRGVRLRGARSVPRFQPIGRTGGLSGAVSLSRRRISFGPGSVSSSGQPLSRLTATAPLSGAPGRYQCVCESRRMGSFSRHRVCPRFQPTGRAVWRCMGSHGHLRNLVRPCSPALLPSRAGRRPVWRCFIYRKCFS